MKHFTAAALVLAASLAAPAVQAQDDADIDVFGPGTRSSLAVTVDGGGSREDAVLRSTGATVGQVRSHDNTLTLSGIWAISPRFNLYAALPWAVGNDVTQSFGAQSLSTEHTGLGNALVLSAWLWGDAGSAGFKLAGSVGTARHAGYHSSQSIQLQPQYRVDHQLLLGAALGTRDTEGFGGTPYLIFTLAWRPSPEWSLVPRFGVVRYGARDGYDAFDDTWVGVTATRHLGDHWSVFGGATWRRPDDMRSSTRPVELVNGEGWGAELGVRHAF